MTPKQLTALVLLAALWGGSFLFMRVAAPALGPVMLIEARVLLAGLVLLGWAALTRGVPRPGAGLGPYLALGAVNAAVPFVLIAAATLVLPASLAATLNATTPLFGALVAAAWLAEPLGARKAGALLLGLAGVALLMGLGPVPLTVATLLGAGASLLAAAFYGVGAVYTRRRFPQASPLALATYSNLAAALVLLPAVPFTLPAALPGATVLAAVAALAVASTAIAYLLYFYLITNVGPVRAVTVTYLVPVFGILWGWAFLHEPIGGGMLAGFALVVVSIALSTQANPSKRGVIGR